MFEIFGTGILGSICGGLFRMAPEVLKFFDKANDRRHELAMFQIQTDLEKTRGENKITERYVDHGVAQLDAIQAAFKEQDSAASNSYRWVSALSALVRPLVTYALFGLYMGVKLAVISYAYSKNADWAQVLQTNWTVEDFGMLNMILTFWFVGRSIEKYKK